LICYGKITHQTNGGCEDENGSSMVVITKISIVIFVIHIVITNAVNLFDVVDI